MKRPEPKILQMPAPKPRTTKAQWEQLALETFAERKCDVGANPDRRAAKPPRD